MSVSLVVASGSRTGQTIPITVPKFVIGRADDCHLKPRSELISRYHCSIVIGKQTMTVRDLGSKNGVYVNGKRISMELEVQHGDKLGVGPLEFFIHREVETKTPKGSKVDSVSDAVDRTLERQGVKTDDEKLTDWLLRTGDEEENLETQTVDASRVLAELTSNVKKEKSDTDKHELGKTEESSTNAASKLVKSFFGLNNRN